MTMLQSRDHNLFTSIFNDRREYAHLIIKLLLVLETEKLVPLFELNTKDKNKPQIGIDATIINNKNKVVCVQDIIAKFGHRISPLVLFFGSNFQVDFQENSHDKTSQTNTFNTSIIFTKQGLILECPQINQHPFNESVDNQISEEYNLFFWENWQKVSIDFAQKEPVCTLIFTGNKGEQLKINQKSSSGSETEQIEQQLPLLFAYFVMKNLWKYIRKISNHSFSIYNPDDFLYLDQDRLNYFTEQVLDNINITEKDLENLVRKVNP